MRRFLLATLVVFITTGFNWFERWAAPDARLVDEHWHEHDPTSTFRVDHDAWARWLERHLVLADTGANRVRYGAVGARERAQLDGYLETLAAIEVTGLAKAEQLAFWLNLYNALTVQAVLDAYPVASIRDIDGVWTQARIEIEGRPLSLDDIEHGIIRPIFAEPRIHYAVNCASVGCPDLRPEPYRAALLDDQLDAAAHAYVNDPRGVAVTAGGEVIASSLYNWFIEDFGGDEAAVLDHVRGFAAPALAARLERARGVDRFDYDWALNDVDRER